MESDRESMPNPPPSPSETAAKILLVDDVPGNLDLLTDALEASGYKIMAVPSGEIALKIVSSMPPDLILLDVLMPGMDGLETCRRLKANAVTRAIPVIFLTAKDEVASVVEGFRVGGADYVSKPFRVEEMLSRVETHLRNHRLTQELRRKNEELEAEVNRRQRAEAARQQADSQLSMISEQEARRWGISAFIGRSEAVVRIIRDIRRLHSHEGTHLLITGESGTGKELIARAIHYGGTHAKGPFVPVNCSAVPAELAESCFFGHLRGAFTGATTDCAGYFEQAHLGTLFLDEIGEMIPALQVKLLRVLENGSLTRVGDTVERHTECRIVAVTNADLLSEIETGRFRKDLYYRLTGFTIEVPPLRERKEDIPLLVDHFLQLLATEMGMPKPGVQSAVLAELDAYDFPGNVRELKNLIEAALIESNGRDLGPEHLRIGQVHSAESALGSATRRARLPKESETILNFVREHGSINNTQCRELLGLGLQRACALLRKLHLAGSLAKESSRRWTQYRLP
jgi:DNA-binding NtrC family response regulator